MKILIMTFLINLLSGLRVYLAQSINSCELCLKRKASSFQVFAAKRHDSVGQPKSSLISLIAVITAVSHLQVLTLNTTLATTAKNKGIIQLEDLARHFYISH